MRKEYGSGLDKRHHFVLPPLCRIGPGFRASELVDLTLRHTLHAVLVSERGPSDRPPVQDVCEICSSISASLLRCGNWRFPSANRTIPAS